MMKTYRKALILGAGLSGLGAARLLAAEGTEVIVAYARPEQELGQAVAMLNHVGARMHFGHTSLPSETFDLCVVSPGFPLTSDWVREARDRCAQVIAELELGWSRARCRTIAVTGSNGKSTAVKWCAESLRAAGLHAVIAGNYGVSVSAAVLEQADPDWLVLEVSSFQLETVEMFRPDIGVLLNIHPNHLDRHGAWSVYTDTKARLFARTREEDVCLVPHAWCDEMRARSGGQGRWVTFDSEANAAYMMREGQVFRDGAPLADLSGTLFGRNGMESTACAVIAVMDAADIHPRAAVLAAGSFKTLPHRVEEVALIRGVRFINDSKSTNLAAIEHALRMVDGRVRLIAGGLAKESDFKRLKEVLADRVENVYLIGKSAEAMSSAWSRAVSCVICGTLDEAIRRTVNEARAGEVVLFSPGCASFDQFRNYEERGEHFTRRVLDLAGKGTS
jgi:UDP-N-acetylmuramoylalanine--D-glutamate ligase